MTETLMAELAALGFGDACLAQVAALQAPDRARDDVGPMEYALRALAPDFDTLPLLVEGHSKCVRLWTEDVVLIRLKPTAYSYTVNRYGEARGTDVVRAKFTAALFRQMALQPPRNGIALRTAFLAAIPSPYGPLLAQRKVAVCNLEVRVKRYYVGSPVHRYQDTERYPSTQACGPLQRWSRLDQPVVCFDWRHPLQDAQGNRLADEPLSDDYAAVWMYNVPHAKALAHETFLWLEAWFATANLRLVDLCVFIDREGHMLYGEISPDCMRVRLGLHDPAQAEAADKDVWRLRQSADALAWRYEQVYQLLFGGRGHVDTVRQEREAT